MQFHIQRLCIILGLMGTACTPLATATLTPTAVPPTASLTAPAPTALPTATNTATPAPTAPPAPTPLPTPVMEMEVQADAAGKIYLDNILLVDTAQEAPGCTTGQVSYAPTREYMVLVLNCLTDETYGDLAVAFSFKADGSAKQLITEANAYLTGHYFYETTPFYEWVPDSARLIFTRVSVPASDPNAAALNGLGLYNAETGVKTLLPTASELALNTGFGVEVIPSPAGNVLAVIVKGLEGVGEVVVYAADGSAETWVTDKAGNMLQPSRILVFAPNEEWLVYPAEPRSYGPETPTPLQQGLVLYNLKTGRISPWTMVSLYSFPLAWSPDSQWIAYLDQNETAPEGGIFVLSVDSTTPIFLAPAPQWSEDDEFTWVGSAAGGPPTLEYYSAETGETQAYSLTP